MESNEKIVDSLNELIQINNDRIEGYERASKETNETDLKLLFERFASKSNMFKSQLNSEVVKRGGKPNESTTASGKVFRVWMDFKAALTGKDRKAILAHVNSAKMLHRKFMMTLLNQVLDYLRT